MNDDRFTTTGRITMMKHEAGDIMDALDTLYHEMDATALTPEVIASRLDVISDMGFTLTAKIRALAEDMEA
jgi:hypothetical protein